MMKSDNVTGNKPVEDRADKWNDLYRIGAISCIAVVCLIIFSIVAYFIWPQKPETTAVQILEMLHTNRFGGLMALDLPMVVINIVNILPILAIFAALSKVNKSYAFLALILGLFASVIILPSRPVIELSVLSDKFSLAVGEAQKNQYLAAAEMQLLMVNGTMWMIYTILTGVSGIINALLMFRSSVFGRAAAVFGLIISIPVLFAVLPGVIKYFAIISMISTIGSIVWNCLVARVFLKLSRTIN